MTNKGSQGKYADLKQFNWDKGSKTYSLGTRDIYQANSNKICKLENRWTG